MIFYVKKSDTPVTVRGEAFYDKTKAVKLAKCEALRTGENYSVIKVEVIYKTEK